MDKLTKLDEFAKAVLGASMSNVSIFEAIIDVAREEGFNGTQAEGVAKYCYIYAEAMLKESEERQFTTM